MSNIKSLINSEIYNNIQALYQQTKPGQEFELIINNIDNKYFGQEKHIQLLKYFKYKQTQLKSSIVITDMLDINYQASATDVYRITLVGDAINDYIKKLDLWKAHVIFKSLVRIAKEKKDVKLMKKIRNKDNTHIVEDFNIKFNTENKRKYLLKFFSYNRTPARDFIIQYLINNNLIEKNNISYSINRIDYSQQIRTDILKKGQYNLE